MSSTHQALSRREFAATAAGCTVASALAARRPALAQKQQDRAGRTAPRKPFRAGACAIDISPKKLPAIVSGMFLERRANKVRDPLHARCLVLDDGATRVAIVVVDSLMMPRELLDEVKKEAQKATGIPTEHMLISATHTHSAPSVMGALGTGVDEAYARYLPGRIVEGIKRAVKNLAPARVGWAVAEDFEHTHCRRWIFLPHKMRTDPFGQRTVRAHMHPGYQNPDCVGPSGPVDPGLSMLSVQSPDGRPIALLANYSMHYYGSAPVSADYYGLFCSKLAQMAGAGKSKPPFVAVMSHGTSGDLHWMDYSKPKKPPGLHRYAEAVAGVALQAYKKIQYHDSATIRMSEKKLKLRRRVPDEKRLAWAKAIVARMGNRKPRSLPEVYALEQIYLHKEPARELVLQALRIGELGITAVPCEVYGITGLKIKAQSPLQPTMNIELANGGEGYIPPPALHPLGGYNTWPARTAGLEVQAEPKIVETVLTLLEEVSGGRRRKLTDAHGEYAKAVLASKPLAYWRLSEFEGPRAADAARNGNHGTYEDGVVFYLEGPESPSFCGEKQINRAAHFAGGRTKAVIKGLGNTYSVELWFWNGMPVNARAVTGYLFSRGAEGAKGAPGDHLGIGGKSTAMGRLLFYNGDALKQVLAGTTKIGLRTWNHVVLVREGKKVAIYLNGNPAPEIAGEAAIGFPPGVEQLFIGGRSDNLFNFEGKIDEAAIYDRALSPDEVAKHYASARFGP